MKAQLFQSLAKLTKVALLSASLGVFAGCSIHTGPHADAPPPPPPPPAPANRPAYQAPARVPASPTPSAPSRPQHRPATPTRGDDAQRDPQGTAPLDTGHRLGSGDRHGLEREKRKRPPQDPDAQRRRRGQKPQKARLKRNANVGTQRAIPSSSSSSN